MSNVILNWRKLKKLFKSDKTDKGINGKDTSFTPKE